MKARKVNIRITITNHLSCKARINGVKANLLIDTGASNSCIALSQKKYFEIKEKGNPFEAAGAGEDKMKAILAHRCNLILGRHLIGQQSFMLLDMQYINATLVKEGGITIDGILGNDFLRKYKVIIDYTDKKMIF